MRQPQNAGTVQENEQMSDGLDVIVLDDDPGIGEILSGARCIVFRSLTKQYHFV